MYRSWVNIEIFVASQRIIYLMGIVVGNCRVEIYIYIYKHSSFTIGA
jgi:hypothetical protein